MKTIAFHNLGCKVNAYETEIMIQNAQNRGYDIVRFSQISDIYVVNTCTVTNIADRKSRQMLHRAKKLNPSAIVVAVGCYVQTGVDALLKDPLVDICIGNNNKSRLIDIIEEYMSSSKARRIVSDDLSIPSDYERMSLSHVSDKVRTFVKIQDGCNQFCSYCAIPLARGRVRSRAVEDIVEEIRTLVDEGCSEIVLTGIHVGSYGIDLDDKGAASGDYGGKGRLVELTEKISRIPGLKRIRLSSVEPRIITEENVKRLSALPNMCPHFHLSLQSGCDATLKRMNRHYTTDEYFESVQLLRKYFDDPAITTDVIAGFPGETDEEFEETLSFVNKVSFADMHIFKFSKRKGTKAETMPDQVDEKIKNERSERLIDLALKNAKCYLTRHIEKATDVLIEEHQIIMGKKYMTGHTPDYILAAIPMPDGDKNSSSVASSQEIFSPGKIARCTLTGILTEEIMVAENQQL